MERFDPSRLERAWNVLKQWVEAGECPAVSAAVGTSSAEPRLFAAGRQSPKSDVPLPADSIFLIASPTKPIVSLALMMLAEAGELLLVDPVSRYVPEFAVHGKKGVTLAHCLTHTSGLPDMLPNNIELRKQHAPLSEFVTHTCTLSLDFAPGHSVQYQSLGILMLALLAERVAGLPMAELLRERVFEPLGMSDTSLGLPTAWEHPATPGAKSHKERIAEVRLPADSRAADFKGPADSDWGWNSDYWRRLGAPWGGLLSTSGDLAKLCRHLLSIHRGGDGLLQPATLEVMTTNRLEAFADLPEHFRRTMPWGYGWRLNWPASSETFGDFLSPAAYGHWGATGTMLWIDPARDAYVVVLTTQPLDTGHRRHARFSNALS